MSDDCFFGGKADICEGLDCRRSSRGSKEQNPANHWEVDASQIEPKRRVDGIVQNGTSANEELASVHTRPIAISEEVYLKLLDNLFVARLSFLRARHITTEQLNVYKKGAIEHMHEMKRIIHKELENPDASAISAAEELVKAGIAVTRNQQTLNRKELEELAKNLNGLLDTLSSNVKEVKSPAEPESPEKIEQISCKELTFDYDHGCWFVLCIFIVLLVGLPRCLTAFEEYFKV